MKDEKLHLVPPLKFNYKLDDLMTPKNREKPLT